jgi:hypothetical protein
MNWPIVRDKIWVLLQLAALIFAAIGIYLATNNNGFWLTSIIVSIIFTGIGIRRAKTLTE